MSFLSYKKSITIILFLLWDSKKSKSNLNLSWIINNNCKWLLSISHPELFTVTVPFTLPAQPSSVPPALNFINAPFSAVLLDHCYFEHLPSLPSYSLPFCCLPRCCLPRCSTVSFSGRQRGRVVRAPDLKSGCHEFKSRSDHLTGVVSRWTLVRLLGHACK